MLGEDILQHLQPSFAHVALCMLRRAGVHASSDAGYSAHVMFLSRLTHQLSNGALTCVPRMPIVKSTWCNEGRS